MLGVAHLGLIHTQAWGEGERPRPARTVDLTVRVSGSPRGRRRS